MPAAVAPCGTEWPMTRRFNSCTSAPRMRRLTIVTSAVAAAGMNSMPHPSSRSTPTAHGHDAAHGMTFIPVMEAGNVIVESVERPAGLVEGQFTTPSFVPEAYDPVAMRSLYGTLPSLEHLTRGLKTNPASRGFLRAWNVAEHRIAWETQTATS